MLRTRIGRCELGQAELLPREMLEGVVLLWVGDQSPELGVLVVRLLVYKHGVERAGHDEYLP